MPKEINPQELSLEYEVLRQEVAAIDQQILELKNHHEALISAEEGIKGMPDATGSDVLIPGGAGVYFKGALSQEDAILVSVGANVIIEMPSERAGVVIEERADQALSMIVKLNEEADAMVKRMREIQTIVMSAQMQQ